MKLKISIALEGRVIAAVDAAALEGESRSQAIERLLRQSLVATERAAVDNRDREGNLLTCMPKNLTMKHWVCSGTKRTSEARRVIPRRATQRA